MGKWIICFISFFTILQIGDCLLRRFSPFLPNSVRLRLRPKPRVLQYDSNPPPPPGGNLEDESDISTNELRQRCRGKYTHGNPLTEEKISNCEYFTCSPGPVYTKHRCPNGLAVQVIVRKDWQYHRRGVDYMPCNKISLKCIQPIAGGSNTSGKISDTPVEICGIDLVFAVDISCSISSTDKAKVKKFIIAASSGIPVRAQYSRIGVLAFSEKVYHVAYMNEFKRQSQLIERLWDMKTEPMQCGTRTDEGLREARETYFAEIFGARSGRQKVLIVLSDGFTYPPKHQKDTFEQARLIHKANIQTYVVGLPNLKLEQPKGSTDDDDKPASRFTQEAAREEWLRIATKPENVFTLTTFDQLFLKLNDIVKSACFTM